ncbi:MAG: hypothetical protein ACOYKZ_01355 [Chlamydiia bacterium]
MGRHPSTKHRPLFKMTLFCGLVGLCLQGALQADLQVHNNPAMPGQGGGNRGGAGQHPQGGNRGGGAGQRPQGQGGNRGGGGQRPGRQAGGLHVNNNDQALDNLNIDHADPQQDGRRWNQGDRDRWGHRHGGDGWYDDGDSGAWLFPVGVGMGIMAGAAASNSGSAEAPAYAAPPQGACNPRVDFCSAPDGSPGLYGPPGVIVSGRYYPTRYLPQDSGGGYLTPAPPPPEVIP